jgi:hypothetical protein
MLQNRVSWFFKENFSFDTCDPEVASFWYKTCKKGKKKFV